MCVISPGLVATDIRSRALGATSPVNSEAEKNAMSVEECVSIIIDAIEHKKRDVVMGGTAKLAMWMKLLAPGMVDDRVASETRKSM